MKINIVGVLKVKMLFIKRFNKLKLKLKGFFV